MTLASPLFLLVAVANWLDDKGPPFYSQWRVGRDGRRFRCLKFRTMRVDADAMMAHWKRTNDPLWQEYERCNFKLKNDPRITRAGGFLRKTSLDELPQLINILKGEMSLVGPRPIMESEIAYYGIDALNCYTRVRPGITGLWQISGRSTTTFERRVELDLQYIKHWSLMADLGILFKTIPVVVFRKGAY